MAVATRYDVIVVGGGVTGLLCAHKFSSIGLTTVLIEREEQLACGPSTRNEGWLHRGTYHAVSIKDRPSAIQVARRCIYGHEQIRQLVPEAVETFDSPAYAMVKEPDRVDEVTSRWDEAGVVYKPVTRSRINQILDGIDTGRAAAAFEVGDLSINTRLVYRKLLSHARRAGVDVFVGTAITHIDVDNRELRLVQSGGGARSIAADRIVYAVGFGARALSTFLRTRSADQVLEKPLDRDPAH